MIFAVPELELLPVLTIGEAVAVATVWLTATLLELVGLTFDDVLAVVVAAPDPPTVHAAPATINSSPTSLRDRYGGITDRVV